jgi:predicted enzyme related to lactoylglutathione lyase
MLTTQYTPGAPNWLDLGSRDIDASVAFYSGLFGWDFQSAGPEAGGYGMFQLDGKTVAAVGPLTQEGARPAWTIYFHTPDADTTVKLVEQAGGTVRMEPFDVFTAGRMAGFADPAGAEFAVWQPGDNKGLEKVGEPGSLCWTELHTTDVVRARAFYKSVFDWDAEDASFPGGTYIVLSTSGGGQEGSFGGMVQLRDEHIAAGATVHWHPYFAVTDVDDVVEKTRQLGGSVIFPADDLEGVGRLAQLADSHGAVFAVLHPAVL